MSTQKTKNKYPCLECKITRNKCILSEKDSLICARCKKYELECKFPQKKETVFTNEQSVSVSDDDRKAEDTNDNNKDNHADTTEKGGKSSTNSNSNHDHNGIENGKHRESKKKRKRHKRHREEHMMDVDALLSKKKKKEKRREKKRRRMHEDLYLNANELLATDTNTNTNTNTDNNHNHNHNHNKQSDNTLNTNGVDMNLKETEQELYYKPHRKHKKRRKSKHYYYGDQPQAEMYMNDGSKSSHLYDYYNPNELDEYYRRKQERRRNADRVLSPNDSWNDFKRFNKVIHKWSDHEGAGYPLDSPFLQSATAFSGDHHFLGTYSWPYPDDWM